MLRIDRESRQALSARMRASIAAIKRVRAKLAGIICSDYGKGVLTARSWPQRPAGGVRLQAPSTPAESIVLVDPKGHDFSRYRGADLLTPNEKELIEADLRLGNRWNADRANRRPREPRTSSSPAPN